MLGGTSSIFRKETILAQLLIRFKDNWADEMDISGLFVMDETAWEQIKERVRRLIEIAGVWDCGIGTNESIEYNSFEEWLTRYTVVPLTPTETVALTDILKKVDIKPRMWDNIEFLVLEGHDTFPWQDQLDEAIEEFGEEEPVEDEDE